MHTLRTEYFLQNNLTLSRCFIIHEMYSVNNIFAVILSQLLMSDAVLNVDIHIHLRKFCSLLSLGLFEG